MNKPYVKQYDKEGNVTNPITYMAVSQHPNRKQRREMIKNLKKNKDVVGQGK